MSFGSMQMSLSLIRKSWYSIFRQRLTTGYAFGREVWTDRGGLQILRAWRLRAHNAAAFFTQSAVDLDTLIGLIRHIDASREISSNYQLGVGLLRGLQYSLIVSNVLACRWVLADPNSRPVRT
jgi:hypothetical protein